VCGVAVWPSVQQCCAAAAYACTNALSAPSSSDFWKPGTRTEHRTRARRAYRIRSGGRPRPSPSSQKPELTEEKGRWSAPPALLGCDSVGTRDPAPAISARPRARQRRYDYGYYITTSRRAPGHLQTRLASPKSDGCV
jgi:hypothetical protein